MLSGITDVWLPPAYKAASGKQDAGDERQEVQPDGSKAGRRGNPRLF